MWKYLGFFLKYLSSTMFCVCFCVCTCTNQLVLRTEVTRLNFLNSIVMGQINQYGFQSHVAIDRYCIFLEIKHLWVLSSKVSIMITAPYLTRLCFYQTRSAWSMDQRSNRKRSAVHNFARAFTKFCVMWEGLSLPHDTKFHNCRGEIVDRRMIFIWSDLVW